MAKKLHPLPVLLVLGVVLLPVLGVLGAALPLVLVGLGVVLLPGPGVLAVNPLPEEANPVPVLRGLLVLPGPLASGLVLSDRNP